ncbi:MAG: hotdog fold domain-containing protein [Myxococcota bacterium]
MTTSLPVSWSAEAWNPVPESENRIHSDDVAKAYGFRGGLVPGVTVSAYLLHPAAVAWGRDWVERGRAHVVVHSPVYDGERFRVEVENARADGYEARLFDPHGVHCASAEVTLPAEAPAPPKRRGDPVVARDASRPTASREVMEALRRDGMLALPARWSEGAEITRYLRDPAAMAPVYHEPGPANPSFLLGLTNWVLGGNVKMSPWLHLETRSQHHRAVEPGTKLVVEAAIADLFEKKGHEFVDVDVAIYPEAEDEAAASVRLRAIYRLRPPGD